MSEEKKEENLTHGFKIDSGGHTHALSYMTDHMNEQQVREMVKRAESGHDADFLVDHNGQKSNFKLEHHDGKFKIYEAHNS